jgi:hypothetical protein
MRRLRMSDIIEQEQGSLIILDFTNLYIKKLLYN